MARRGIARALTGALVALAFAAGAAHASETLEFNPGGAFELTSSSVTFRGSEISITCPVTLSGTFASSIAAVEGEAIGSVTSASIAPETCSPGGLTLRIRRAAFLGLPWPITLTALQGSLPAITRVDVAIANVGVLFHYEAEIAGPLECLSGGSLAARLPVSEGTVSSMAFAPSTSLAFVRDLTRTGLCALTLGVSGSFALSPTQTVSIR